MGLAALVCELLEGERWDGLGHRDVFSDQPTMEVFDFKKTMK